MTKSEVEIRHFDPEWSCGTWRCRLCDALGFLPMKPLPCRIPGCPVARAMTEHKED